MTARNAVVLLLAATLCAPPDVATSQTPPTAATAGAYEGLHAAEAGADMDALEHQAYDIVTIAAAADDADLLRTALANGASPANITSHYDGTALIAAAHLGHHEVVGILAVAGAPLDHVNNLGCSALNEAVVLGDGGENHRRTVEAPLDASADRAIADRNGVTPLGHARERSYDAIAQIIEAADREATE